MEYHNNHAGVNLFKKAFTTYILPVITLSVILCVPKWMELELSKQYLFKNETKNDGSVVSKHKNIFFWKLLLHTLILSMYIGRVCISFSLSNTYHLGSSTLDAVGLSQIFKPTRNLQRAYILS